MNLPFIIIAVIGVISLVIVGLVFRSQVNGVERLVATNLITTDTHNPHGHTTAFSAGGMVRGVQKVWNKMSNRDYANAGRLVTYFSRRHGGMRTGTEVGFFAGKHVIDMGGYTVRRRLVFPCEQTGSRAT